MKKHRSKLAAHSFVLIAFAWVWAIITLYPLFVTFSSSLKDNTEIFGSMFKLPASANFQNYYDALFNANMLRSIANSLLLAFSTTAMVILIASMASYVLARKQYFFVKPIYFFFLGGSDDSYTHYHYPHFEYSCTYGGLRFLLVFNFGVHHLPASAGNFSYNWLYARGQ